MISPGPGTVAVMARGLGSGFSHAYAMGMGMVLGDLLYVLTAIFGLGFIANSLGGFFVIVRYMGGVYLLYLGFKIFFSNPSKQKIKSSSSKSYLKDFVSGLMICLSNPKVILFYLGFLPTFVDLRNLTSTEIVTISLIVVILLMIVMFIYAYFSSMTKEAMKKPKTQRFLNRFAGSVMFGTGSILLLKA